MGFNWNNVMQSQAHGMDPFSAYNKEEQRFRRETTEHYYKNARKAEADIPDKIIKIIEDHDHDIQVGEVNGAYMAIIGTNLPVGYYYEHNIILEKTSVQDFLETLDRYYNNDFDPEKEAEDIYSNNIGEVWNGKIVGKDITLEDITEDMKEEDTHFYAMFKDLWENSPRVNQNDKDLLLIE